MRKAEHAIVIKYRGGGTPEVYANHMAVTTGGVYEYMNTRTPSRRG